LAWVYGFVTALENVAIYDFYGPGSLTALSVARLKISGKYATCPAADRLGPFISPRIPPFDFGQKFIAGLQSIVVGSGLCGRCRVNINMAYAGVLSVLPILHIELRHWQTLAFQPHLQK